MTNSADHAHPTTEASFLSGFKQRLLSFIFRGIWIEEEDPTLASHIHRALVSFFSVYLHPFQFDG